MKRDLPFDVDDAELQTALARKVAAAIELLWDIAREFDPAALASSLGAEDMVLTDLIVKHAPTIEIFTLDTGRLHAETYRLLQQITDHYDLRIRVVYPSGEALERLVAEHGINGFFNSVASRKTCCEVRKVEPLRRALAGKRAWITGLRRAQSPTRARLPLQEHDAANGLEKFNPLSGGRSLPIAVAEQSVTLLLDRELDISRGDMMVEAADALQPRKQLDAMLCWLSETPLDLKRRYLLRHTTREVKAVVAGIDHRLDINTLERGAAARLQMNDIGRVSFKLAQPLSADPYATSRSTGAFIVIDEASNNTVGAGMIL
jgi:hypothetical protein